MGNTYTINCPQCQETLQLEENYAGMEINCPTCNNKFIAPPPPSASPSGFTTPLTASTTTSVPPLTNYQLFVLTLLTFLARFPGIVLIFPILALLNCKRQQGTKVEFIISIILIVVGAVLSILWSIAFMGGFIDGFLRFVRSL